MNEKKLREQFNESMMSTIVRYGQNTRMGTNKLMREIADFWLARMKERDEKLKKAILANTGLQNDECCMDIKVFSANDVLKIIDNHA